MDSYSERLLQLYQRESDKHQSEAISLRKEACSITNACLALDGEFQTELTLDLQSRWIAGEITTEQRIASIQNRLKDQK